MPDDIVGSAWSLDAGTQAALRLELARRALRERDLLTATIELEELLDDEPDHVEALILLGATCIAQGDHPTARAALRSAHQRGAGSSATWAQLALAELECWDFEAAAAAAREATARNAENPEGWHVLGLLAERRDAFAEADEHHMRAWTLQPTLYPLPVRLRPEDWEGVVQTAMDALGDDLSAFWADVPLQLEAFPERDERWTPGLSPREIARCEGDAGGDHPDTLRIFWGNLAHAGSVEDLLDDLVRALDHEATAWLQPDDERDGEE
ncbi:MAG TPA: hypothetical protein PKA64_23105 [Myxococcota bacterium]|nr:hypothetical protein [Myxococcota bacterium]